MAIYSEHRSRWPVLIFRGAHPENAHGIPEAFSPKSVRLEKVPEYHLDGLHDLLEDSWNNWRPKPKSLLVTFKGRHNINNINIEDFNKQISYHGYHNLSTSMFIFWYLRSSSDFASGNPSRFKGLRYVNSLYSALWAWALRRSMVWTETK